MLAQLDALLAGESDMRVIRPPVPSVNPRRDLFGPRPASSRHIEDLLGAEYFTKPEPVFKPRDMRMYSIGDLAKMLGRKPGTIRVWISTGVIPEADHWSAGDTVRARKRRFTSEQVVGLQALASQEGILERPHKDISKTNFVARAHELWEELR